MYLSCITLLSMGPKLDKFVQKEFNFGSSPLPLIKSLVALLVAFTVAEQTFQAIIWAGYKTILETIPALYISFFRYEYRVVKAAHNL